MYFAFMDLGKAYDKVNKRALWQVASIYGVMGKLLRALQSLYYDNRMCIRVREVCIQGGSKARLCDVSLVIEHIHGWCSQGGVC